MHPSDQAAKDPLVGRTIAGKFRIEAFVGRGAMGAVYKATHVVLKKTVAIKVMNPDKPADGAYASRFKREAKAASRMDHPNSLRVIDFGEDEGLLYIAMEFVQGKDLLQVLKAEFPLTKERIVSVLSQTLAALAVAHEMGVIHRDLKPENIMILPTKDDEGRPMELVKVCDFGIAKILEPERGLDVEGGPTRTATHTGTLTAHGMLIGTPEYMSPEQARGEPADARSDLYSLGVILFQLLTGRLPFIANSKIRLVIKHVEELPPQPSELDSRVDLRLESICMKALQKRPEDRYQSAREMRTDLKLALEGHESVRLPTASSPLGGGGPRHDSGAGTAITGRASDPPRGKSDPPRKSDPPKPISTPPPRPEQLDTLPAETMDPQEAALAVLEARKILSGRPPAPSSSSTPSTPAVEAVRPGPASGLQPEASKSPSLLVIALMIITLAAVAAVVVMALKK